MKLLITSDWHGDWVTHGVRRFAEITAAVDETVRAAVENDVAGYVFMGDLCNPDAGSSVFRTIELALRTAMRLHDARIPSIWVAGNHDVIEDGTKDTTLSPLRALGAARGVHVFEEPGVCLIMNGGRLLNVLALPFTAAQHGYDVEATAAKLLGKRSKKDTIAVGHLHVPGVAPGEETTEMPRGREVILPVDALRPHVSKIFNGHYHRQQRTESGVWIPGSLARLTFCEERHDPGYLVVEV